MSIVVHTLTQDKLFGCATCERTSSGPINVRREREHRAFSGHCEGQFADARVTLFLWLHASQIHLGACSMAPHDVARRCNVYL